MKNEAKTKSQLGPGRITIDFIKPQPGERKQCGIETYQCQGRNDDVLMIRMRGYGSGERDGGNESSFSTLIIEESRKVLEGGNGEQLFDEQIVVEHGDVRRPSHNLMGARHVRHAVECCVLH